jgi:hypothetical protein
VIRSEIARNRDVKKEVMEVLSCFPRVVHARQSYTILLNRLVVVLGEQQRSRTHTPRASINMPMITTFGGTRSQFDWALCVVQHLHMHQRSHEPRLAGEDPGQDAKPCTSSANSGEVGDAYLISGGLFDMSTSQLPGRDSEPT